MDRAATKTEIRAADHGHPAIDELELQAEVRRIRNHWPTVGLAVGVIRDGSLGFFSGQGSQTSTRTRRSRRTPSSGSPRSPRLSLRSP